VTVELVIAVDAVSAVVLDAPEAVTMLDARESLDSALASPELTEAESRVPSGAGGSELHPASRRQQPTRASRSMKERYPRWGVRARVDACMSGPPDHIGRGPVEVDV